MNYNKEIPEIHFPENKIPVMRPKEEKLVYLNDYFLCDSKYNHWIEDDGKPLPGSSPIIAVRETVASMLWNAQKFLPTSYKFKIYDGYRPIAVQQALWNYFRKIKERENPGKTAEEIDKLTAFCVSFPSYDVLNPSLHNTGGAVDLTIVDSTNHELNMGCEFDEFTDKAWTNHFETNYLNGEKDELVRDNRRMLYNIMISAGFTNLPSEWWHYDYGDDKWAQLNNTMPIYRGILDVNLPETVPYCNMEAIRELDKTQGMIINSVIAKQEECDELREALSVIVRNNLPKSKE